MTDTLNKLWNNIVQWFHAEAEQLHYVQFDQTDAPTLKPNDSYIRIVISELWVKNSVDWGKEKFPAVQAAAKLAYGGQTPTTFATLARPTAEQLGPGVFRDYELTYLMPYLGQTVEIELGLYEILGKNHLQTALDVVGDFASLVAPPLSTAVTVMDKVASGIDRVITANGSGPVLGLHGTLSPAGGQADGLRPGWIAVVARHGAATPEQQPAHRRRSAAPADERVRQHHRTVDRVRLRRGPDRGQGHHAPRAASGWRPTSTAPCPMPAWHATPARRRSSPTPARGC